MGKQNERTEMTATAVRVEKERRINYEFALTEPVGEEQERKVGVLSCSFRKAGISYATYEPHPTEFIAVFRAETEKKWEYGTSRSFTMFQGPSVLIAREETQRYSAKKLAEFAEGALAKLQALAEEDNEQVQAVIELEP